MKKNVNRYKIKDFVFLGIITAIYFILFAGVGMATAAMNPFLHAFSPALISLIGGTVILFLIYKVPRFGVLTMQSLLLHALFFAIGMGYLPWFLSTIICAFIGDLIAYSKKYENTMLNGVGYGMVQVGMSLGGIIPAVFFADKYISEWTARGMSEAEIRRSLETSTGWIAVVVLIASFSFAVAGVYIGAKILKKHFKKD